jgi:hypothetical protein
MFEHLILREAEIEDELRIARETPEYQEAIERLPSNLDVLRQPDRDTWYIAALGWLASQAALLGNRGFKVHQQRHPLITFIYYARRFFLESYTAMGRNEESESLYNNLFMDFSDPFPELTNQLEEAESLAKQGWRPI